jgi:hypothetical protein
MSFKTITLALAADVANSGNITGIAYPAGTNQAFFTGANASAGGVAVVNENDVYSETDSKIAITYGGSTITVQNTSGVTWPAGSTLRVQLDYAAADTVTVVQQAVIADLGGSLTGTNNSAIADLTTLTDSPATADALRDQLMSAWKVEIDSHFKEVQAKINGILAALRAANVLDT